MIKDGGERIATRSGAVLRHPGGLEDVAETWFEPAFWAERGELRDVIAGRGAAWFIGAAGRWVLRHYRRGGWVAHLSTDTYVWHGEKRVRAFAEWRLLAVLFARGLPVPRPVGARYRRSGLVYRCDLIVQRIEGAQPLSALLEAAPLSETLWRAVGAAIARLHAAGADHADLNAHNILIAPERPRGDAAMVSVIDFDRGRLRPPGAWSRGNLARLRRSLEKVSRRMPADRFSAPAWKCLLDGYALHL
jgi:3-deoxy-D-manno-octulosonic acid kinase